jgi:hypothetical protein
MNAANARNDRRVRPSYEQRDVPPDAPVVLLDTVMSEGVQYLVVTGLDTTKGMMLKEQVGCLYGSGVTIDHRGEEIVEFRVSQPFLEDLRHAIKAFLTELGFRVEISRPELVLLI